MPVAKLEVQAALVRGLRLLALDGGGIRGLSQLFILQEIMRRLAVDLSLEEDALPYKFFDMIAGCGTGGFIAILLGRLKMSVDQAIEAYITLCRYAFEKSSTWRLWRGPETEIKASIQRFVDEDLDQPMLTQGDADRHICKSFVCSLFEENLQFPQLIRSYDVRANNGPQCSIWQAIRATTGHPFFVEPTVIDIDSVEKRLFSTRFRWNNPLGLLMTEVQAAFADPQPISCIVNVGSGHPPPITLSIDNIFSYFLPSSLLRLYSNTLLLQTLQSIAADCEAIVNEFHVNFPKDSRTFKFIRLSVDNGMQSVGLADWKKRSEVKAHTAVYTAHPGANRLIDKVVQFIAQVPDKRASQAFDFWDESVLKPLLHSSQDSLPLISYLDLTPLPVTYKLGSSNTFSLIVASYRNELVVVKRYHGNQAERNLAIDSAFYRHAHFEPSFPPIIGASHEKSNHIYLVFGNSRNAFSLSSNHCGVPGSIEQYLARALTQNASVFGFIAGAKMFYSLASALTFISSSRLPFFTDDKPNIYMWVDANENILISLGDTSLHSLSGRGIGQSEDLLVQCFQLLSRQTIKSANESLHPDLIEQGATGSITSLDVDGLANPPTNADAVDSLDDSLALPETQRSDDSFPAETRIPFLAKAQESARQMPSKTVELRRELIYRESQIINQLDLEQVAQQNLKLIQIALLKPKLPNIRRIAIRDHLGVPHRCSGYSREEILISPYIADSGVVTYSTPNKQERCIVCGRLVTIGHFECPCGSPDDGIRPTTPCNIHSRCIVWGHQHCGELFQKHHVFKASDTGMRTNKHAIDLSDASLEVRSFMDYVRQILPDLAESRELLPTYDEPVFLPIELVSNYRKCYEETWQILIQNIKLCRDRVDFNEILLSIIDDVTFVIDLLNAILEDPNKTHKQYLSTPNSRSQAFLNLLQEILELGMFPHSQDLFRQALVKLARSCGLHPECLTLPGKVKLGSNPVAIGSYADIWKGTIAEQTVAIKSLRLWGRQEKDELIKMYLEEGLLWGQLRHPNILPLLGLFSIDERLCLVFPWMENDNLINFIKANPSANRTRLAHDIAHGVLFLHQNQIVHGDLKGSNIMITSEKRACIADLGLSKILDPHSHHWTTLAATAASGGTIRWQAPELFESDISYTFETDVYAIGCVFYEIFSGRLPYYNLRFDGIIVNEVKKGVRPLQPSSDTGLTDQFWNLTESCWAGDPKTRPSSKEIVDTMHSQREWSCLSFQLCNYGREDVQRAARKFPILPTMNEIQRYLNSDYPMAKPRGPNSRSGSAEQLESTMGIVGIEDAPSGMSFADFVTTWQDDEVAQWLTKIKCADCIDIFRSNSVHGDTLFELSQGHLKEMGILKLGDRLRIANGVNALRQKAFPSSSHGDPNKK